MNRVRSRSDGFTLVELMLAMAFVSALLLAIAMTVIQIGNIYSRGLAFKNINQAGLTFSSAIQANINNSQLFSVNGGGGAQPGYLNSPGVGGRLCLGNYSYIWNYGIAINNPSPPANINRYNDMTIVTFAKVPDPAAEYCKTPVPKLRIDPIGAINLLDSGQYNLAIHDIVVTSTTSGIDSKTKQGLYSVKITIGTNNASAIDYLAISGPTCRLPNHKDYDPLCYINTFNIVARAGNTIQ